MTSTSRKIPAWVWVLVVAALAVGVYMMRPAANPEADSDSAGCR